MYGKIFSQIFDGTLATKGPWQALVTFEQLIVLANKHGEVDMTAEAISRRTTIPIDYIRIGLEALVLPDPDSRSPDEEGRRIVLIDPTRTWGWRIVNHEHYRKIRSEEERREYHKNYMRKRRAVNLTVNLSTTGDACQPISVSSKQDANTKAEDQKIKTPPAKRAARSPIDENFAISDEVRAWAARNAYIENLDKHFDAFCDSARANGYKYANWDSALKNAIRKDWAGLNNPLKKYDQPVGKNANAVQTLQGMRSDLRAEGSGLDHIAPATPALPGPVGAA